MPGPHDSRVPLKVEVQWVWQEAPRVLMPWGQFRDGEVLWAGARGGGEATAGAEPQAPKLNVNAPLFPHQNTTSLYVAANKTQTALATIGHPHQPTVSQKVRAVLDLGSQRSYITEQAARRLSLESEGAHNMSVFTFGSSAKTLRNCELVRVLMKTLDGNLELHLLTTPIICEPFPVQPITPCINSFEHLSNLKFADSSDGNSALEVDLLIGSDHYWELATGKVSRGRDGPIAVETKLGWVLSGPARPHQSNLHAVFSRCTH